MADMIDSTETGSVSTSAPVETVETTTETAQPSPAKTGANDVWENIGNDATDETDTGKLPPVETEDKKDSEKPLEDQVLDEAFSETDDKPAESKDEDADPDKMDSQEVLDRQRNATAKAAAERWRKKADFVKDFQYPDKETGAFKPITEVAKAFEDINQTRYSELSQYAAHQLVDSNPDATFQRAYAVKMLQQNPQWDYRTATIPTLDELIAGNGNKTVDIAPPTPNADLDKLTADLSNQLDWDWRDESLDENFVDDREMALARTVRAMEAKVQAEATSNAELQQKLEQATKELEGVTAKTVDIATTELQSKVQETIGAYRASVAEKILPYIAKNTGLEISKDDSPEIVAFKESRMELYQGTAYEKANGLDSAFETFAYHESSVKKELETLVNRVVNAQVSETKAILAGKSEDAAKHHAEAEDEKVPIFQLLAQANKEFKAKRIAPDMALLGKLSNKLAEPLKQASNRVEVVSNGASTPAPAKKNYATAEDIWQGVVDDAEREDALRANA